MYSVQNELMCGGRGMGVSAILPNTRVNKKSKRKKHWRRSKFKKLAWDIVSLTLIGLFSTFCR